MREVDNRNLDDMLVFYEARIEALADRIGELEQENRELRAQIRERLDNVQAFDLEVKK